MHINLPSGISHTTSGHSVTTQNTRGYLDNITNQAITKDLVLYGNYIIFSSGFRMPVDSFERMCKKYLEDEEPEKLV